MTSSWSGEQAPTAVNTLDVRPLFNPIDCRSLGVIKMALRSMARGTILEVLANHFQRQEIQAWVKKFSHRIVHESEADGLVKIFIENVAE